ncbi:MAG: metal transporter substrate-binding protein [Herbinix sp.]|jgi:NitT/TauT family transport system substrate-binding protein|nr:metal transporter substrate-binding protein [Herbinix sp.]
MKKITRFALLLITTLTLSACAKGTQLSGHELTIGILPAESAIPIILAKEKGFFEEAKLDVSIQAFSSPNDRNVAVQAKELDAVIGDVMTCATFVDKGIAMKITSDISEDFKILSSPESGITKMEDLSGKKISLVPNFILEYIMDHFAAEYGFDYEVVEIPSFSQRAEALMSNQIDGVLFTEPQAGMLAQQGAHLLGSSKEAGIKGGTLQFTEEMLTNYSGDIRAFYQAYNKAVDYMNNTDVTEYSSILTNYQFPEAISNYLTGMVGDFQYAGAISEDQFNDIITWTKDKGQISKSYTYDELTDFSFIK